MRAWIDISAVLLDQLDNEAQKQNVTRSDVIEEILGAEFLDEDGNAPDDDDDEEEEDEDDD